MANSDKNIRITTSKNKTTFPNIVFTGSSAGTSVLTLEVRDDNTVAFTGADGDVFALDYNLSTGTIWSVNDKSGTPFLRASAGGTIGIAEFGTGVRVGIGQTNPQYKFDVQGWAGFASSGDGSYTVLIENGASAGNNALSIRAANALRFYNTGNTLYTAFVGSQSGVNTTYILPPTSPSSIGASFLTSTQSGTLAWIAAPSGSSSGTVNSGTQNYAAYYATSTTAVSQNANLQFTGTGLSVGGNLNSTSTTSGSIYVWGGLGITGNAFIGGTAYIPSTTPSNISNLLISNSTVSTSTTSGALVITGGVGIGGSLYTGTGSSSSISGVVLANGTVAATTYNKLTLTTPTNNATLTLADGSTLSTSGSFGLTLTTTAASNVTFPTAGTLLTSGATSPSFLTSITTSSSSFDVFNTNATTINAFGAATALNLGQTTGKTTIRSTDVSTSTSTGSLVVSGGAGIAGSLYTGTGFSSSISGVILANNTINASTFNKVTITAPTNSATLALVEGSSLSTAGANSLTLTTGGTTNVTFPTGTKTLVATDVTSLASLTTASTLNSVGTITSGTWSAIAITSFYGGTGHSSFTNGDLLVGFGGTLAKLPASANTGYVLTSTGAASVPSWQSVPSSAASSVAAIASTSNQSFFITTVSGLNVSGVGLSTITSFVVNPFTGLVSLSGLAVTSGTNASSTQSGALQVLGGLGLTGNAFIGGTAVITNNQSSSSITSGALSVTGGLGLAGNAFIGGTVSITTITPSITSNSGALVVLGGLGLAGNAFIGSTINIASTSRSSIGSLLVPDNTSSTSTATGAFIVTGGVGIAGNAFIGGTTVHTSSQSSSSANSGSVTLAGGLGIAGNAFIGGTVVSISSQSSSSVNSGALSIAGGLGLAGNAFIGGTTVYSSSQSSSSSNSGAITVAGGLGLAGNAFIGGTVNITNTTATGSTISGALVVAGGAAFGQSVSVNGRMQLFNGALYTGLISAQSGVNTTYTLPPTSPSSIGASFLTSTQSGVMAWISAPTGGSATPGGTNDGDIQYKSGSSFAAATTLNYDTNIGQLSVSSFPLSSVTSTSAALKLLGTSQSWTGSSLGSFLAINAAVGFVGDLIHAQVNGVSRLQLSGDGYLRLGPATGTGFTLPITNGTSGQVLTANTNGIASWTTVSSTGAGSGTVAIPGGQYQVAAYYWSATGASVSGSSTFTNNTSTGIARITHTTPSTSTSTGALVVDGSVGVGGSLYIGGQINQTYQPTIGAAIDHAVFIQSTPVPTTIGSLIQIGPAAKWDGSTAGYFTGSFSGTYIGINAASGNTADLLNFQQNGQPVFKVGAGGTTFQIGQPLDYAATDVLASFKSTVNSYAQFIIQNKSSGAIASADFVLNNDQSNDTTFFGNLGMNSSGFSGAGALAAPNAVYLTSTSGPLVLASTTQHPIRILTNGTTTDLMYIHESGTAISVFTNLDLRSQNDLRFFNTGNTFYTGIQAANNTANYTLSLPTAPVATGSSLIIVGSDSNMYFVAQGSGIAFSAPITNLPVIRAKRSLNLQFCTSYTPVAAGSDTAILRVPESANDGTTLLTYNLRRFQARVETPSAGSSAIQLEKSSTDTGAFTLAATGSSYLVGTGASIAGAGIYLTSSTFAAGTFVTSGNLLRLNWTTLNATHANFSVNLILEEV